MDILSNIKEGSICKIKSVDSGSKSTKRLYEMGLHTGAEVKVKKNDGINPLILGIHGANIGIGRPVAARIHVSHGRIQ